MKKPTIKNKKWILHCPKCKTTFDVSEQMNQWKGEFIQIIEEGVEKLKNDKGK